MASSESTKVCSRCHQTLPVSAFGSRKANRDGLMGYCRECYNAGLRAYRQTPAGRSVAKRANRKHTATPQFKANRRIRERTRYKTDPEYRAKILAACREYSKTEAGRQTRSRASVAYRQQHPERVLARSMVNRAILAGRLVTPKGGQCFVCSGVAEEYHHILGYDRQHWFDVLPICKGCHEVADSMSPASID